MKRLTIIPLCLTVCCFYAQGQTVYRNRNYGFSVVQPKGWTRYGPFDKNGVGFEPSNVTSTRAEIRVGGRVIQPWEDAPSGSQIVDKIMYAYPDVLGPSGHAVILKREHTVVGGMDAGLMAIKLHGA